MRWVWLFENFFSFLFVSFFFFFFSFSFFLFLFLAKSCREFWLDIGCPKSRFSYKGAYCSCMSDILKRIH